MISAKIIKIVASCIAGLGIVGGIYFIDGNNDKVANTTVIDSNKGSIVKESNDEISSNNDNSKKEETKIDNISDQNEKGVIDNNLDSNSEYKEEKNTSTIENNQEKIEVKDENLVIEKNEEVQNNNKVNIKIEDITSGSNQNNGQTIGGGTTSNESVPSTEKEEVSNSNTSDSSAYIAEIEQLIFQKVNQERVAAGLSALNYNNTMEHYARLKSKDMGDRGYFDHADPEGKYITEQMKSDGVTYRAWGENIAYISGTSGNSALADKFMTNWMNSSGHRANILSTNFTSIGIGVYKIGNTYYATQEFYK